MAAHGARSTRAIALFLPHGSGERPASLLVEAIESGWLSLTPRNDGSIVTFYSDARTRQDGSVAPEVLVRRAIFRAAEMALAEGRMADIGPVYREALRERYRAHRQRRRDVYRQAAERFPDATFWSQSARRHHVLRDRLRGRRRCFGSEHSGIESRS